jgi:tRNA (guanine37-N1)-methyltransferase
MSLRDLLKNRVASEKLSHLPKGFEVIGDIAIISIPPSLEREKYAIAEALASHRKDVKVVLRKKNKLQGPERVREFEVLLGNRTVTMHRENGCVYQVDLSRTYFSGKMAFERSRIVKKVKNGEQVLVLFCGVGPFLIPIKKYRDVFVIGLDNNPDACSLCRKNAEINGTDADVILADANSMDVLFKKKFSRIIMPGPYGQDSFLNLARNILEPDGMIHFYTFKKDFEIPHFRRLLIERGWRICMYRNCGSVAPRVNRYVFDLKKNGKDQGMVYYLQLSNETVNII